MLDATTLLSPAATPALDKVIARLAAHETVVSILTMGWTGGERLKPESDHDLFVILAGLPAPIWQGFTCVDRRLTEIYFAPVAALERLVAEGAVVPADTIDATWLEWLQTGRTVFDCAGCLERARERARELQPAAVRERNVYAGWYKINYVSGCPKRRFRGCGSG